MKGSFISNVTFKFIINLENNFLSQIFKSLKTMKIISPNLQIHPMKNKVHPREFVSCWSCAFLRAMFNVGNINMFRKINCESIDIILIVYQRIIIFIIKPKPIISAPRASHGVMFNFMHDIGIAISFFFEYELREFNCSRCDFMKESHLRWCLWRSHKEFQSLVIVVQRSFLVQLIA